MILHEGQVLDSRYRVEKFVGSGGMAEVYKVWDARRNTYLALKLLNENIAEDLVFLRRFKKEAEALQRLDTPNIVRFYELKEADHFTFFLMDFVEGYTLRKEIFQRRSPFPPERILEIFRPVCSALHYAHVQGVIHCDVKPANIMIETTGKVLLADFGIAHLSETATTTTSFATAGTSAYMAPEQVQGLRLRPPTDVYSLGIILFELLSGGERPFTGEAAQITGSIEERVRWEQVHQPPPPIRAYNPQVSAEAEQVMLRCLEKDPACRFASTLELLKSLEMAFEGVDRTSFEAQEPATSPLPAGQAPLISGPAPLPQPVFHPESDAPAGEAFPAPQPAAKPDRRNLMIGAALGGVLLVGLLFGVLLAGTGGPGPAPTPTPALTSPGAAVAQVLADTKTVPAALTLTSAPTLTLAPTLPRPTAAPTPTLPLAGPPPCTSIGQTWERLKDHATMACIPAGSFWIGQRSCGYNGCQNEVNGGNVDLPGFWIDLTKVTNDQFQQFINDTGYVTGAEDSGSSEVFTVVQPVAGANWRFPQGPGSSISRLGDHPVVQMNWFSANAYCEWAGGLLPSEAEWEKAARGTQGHLFPWGDDYPSDSLLNAADRNFQAAWANKNQDDGYRYTSPVGNYPAGNSPYLLQDMAGNAFEWTRSLLKDYPYDPTDGREISAGAMPGYQDKMVLRGSSFYTDYGTVRSTRRTEGVAQRSTDGTGFRCVIDPQRGS